MLTEFFHIIELIVPALTGAVMWQLWNMNASAKKTADNAAGGKQQSWDNYQELQAIKIEILRLREEHKEIQAAQHRADDQMVKFSEDVQEKVNTIMRDHGDHEVGQARIEAKLEELVRRAVK